MIRTHQYKYAVDQEGRGFYLFDLKHDPLEQNNLIGQPGFEKLEQDMRNLLFARLLKEQYIL